MRFFAIGIEYPFLVPVRRSPDANPGEHRGPAARRDKYKRFHRRLPLRRGMLWEAW
jgi:hypothetical protein